MPKKVRLAAVLMWLVWASGAIYLLGAWLAAMRTGLSNATVLASSYAVVLIALAILIRAVTLGRNWARLVYAGLAMIAVGSIIRAWSQGGLGPGHVLIAAGLIIAYAVILVSLFHSSSAPWFDKSRRNVT